MILIRTGIVALILLGHLSNVHGQESNEATDLYKAEAQFESAKTLDTGSKFGSEVRQAFELYKLSADAGYPPAMLVTGQMYLNGRGTPENRDLAIKYIEKAASRGNAEGLYNLAELEFADRDFAQAYVLFSLASTLAETDSIYASAKNQQQETALLLNKEQIDTLQSIAVTCAETNFLSCTALNADIVDAPRPRELASQNDSKMVPTETNVITEPTALSEDPLITEINNTNEDKNYYDTSDNYPSHWSTEERNLIKSEIERLNWPEDVEMLVRCQAFIGAKGYPVQTHCPSATSAGIDEKSENDLTIQIQDIIAYRPMVPLKIKGSTWSKPRNLEAAFGTGDVDNLVQVYVSVSISSSDKTPIVNIRENHLYNASTYGPNYISAQGYDLRDWRCLKNDYGLVIFDVDSNGSVGNITDYNDALSKKCFNSVKKSINGSKYIPAFYEGEPVASKLVMLVNANWRFLR